MKNPRKVIVIGVGMTKFFKPGEKDYPELSKEAGEQALDGRRRPLRPDRAGVRRLRATASRPAASARSTSSASPASRSTTSTTTARPARRRCYLAVPGDREAASTECVLALGFEKMETGSLGAKYTDRTNPMDKHMQVMMVDAAASRRRRAAAQMFGGAGREHMEKYGTTRRAARQDRR
mgnify:CR=1 FL=1